MGLVHTAILVTDLDAAEAFFVDGLGMEREREIVGGDGVRNVFVAGESGTPIQLRDSEGAEFDPAGVDHLAVQVDDVAGVAERLVDEFGAEVLRGPADHGDNLVVFLEGVDGYVLELMEPIEG